MLRPAREYSSSFGVIIGGFISTVVGVDGAEGVDGIEVVEWVMSDWGRSRRMLVA